MEINIWKVTSALEPFKPVFPVNKNYDSVISLTQYKLMTELCGNSITRSKTLSHLYSPNFIAITKLNDYVLKYIFFIDITTKLDVILKSIGKVNKVNLRQSKSLPKRI